MLLEKKIMELYWTISRHLGLAKWHGRETDLLLYAFYPITILPALLLKKTKWRLFEEPVGAIESIGHLACDFDSFFKDHILKEDGFNFVFVRYSRNVANPALYALWKQRMKVVEHPFLALLLQKFLKLHPELHFDMSCYCHPIRTAGAAYRVQGDWGDRPPLLQLTSEDVERGNERLGLLGVPPSAWFVCIHCREAGYKPQTEWINSYRNADVRSYILAIKEIVSRGGWCIRMGDPTMQPLPPMANVIDYAHSPLRSDWMDLFLCAKCHFFLGTSSGLSAVAGIFGRPSALANMVPLGCAFAPFPNDLSITKQLLGPNDALISAEDAFATELSEYRYDQEFSDANVKIIDNTPEEIRLLTCDMFEAISGNKKDHLNFDEQLRFKSLMREHHYSWGAASNIAPSFLSHLLGLRTRDDRVEDDTPLNQT